MVSGINTRVFNCDPSVLIPISFTFFVNKLSYEMTNYYRLLKQVINLDASKLEGSEHVIIRIGDDDC